MSKVHDSYVDSIMDEIYDILYYPSFGLGSSLPNKEKEMKKYYVFATGRQFDKIEDAVADATKYAARNKLDAYIGETVKVVKFPLPDLVVEDFKPAA